ncbi:MAG: O-antigen ligase family protein, partial [Alphaproteobacteria bacterium]
MVAAFVVILLTDSDSVILGHGVGAAVFALSLALPRIMPWVMGAVVATGVVMAPMIPDRLPDPFQKGPHLSWLTPSAALRLIIWRTAAKHIKEKPVLGGGFDTARGLYSKKDRVYYKFPDEIVGRPWGPVKYEPIPLHPHNGILQVWLELGAVGAVILLVLLLSVVRGIQRLVGDRVNKAAALAAMTTGLTIGSISFGVWQSWWLSSILLGGAFMAALLGPIDGTGPVSESPASEKDEI